MTPLDSAALLDPKAAARYLLGAVLRRELPDGSVVSGRIVETEAYFETDPASHTFGGPTERNRAMFGPPGHAYIYLSYGLHWCLNVTAGPEGFGGGVLLRALEPVEGIDIMRELRGRPDRELTSGPGRLSQALAIDASFYGHDLSLPPLSITGGGTVAPELVTAGPRIGISRAVEEPLRFYVTASKHVSRRSGRRP